MTRQELKGKLVAAHRAKDWELAKQLSQKKERLKRRKQPIPKPERSTINVRTYPPVSKMVNEFLDGANGDVFRRKSVVTFLRTAWPNCSLGLNYAAVSNALSRLTRKGKIKRVLPCGFIKCHELITEDPRVEIERLRSRIKELEASLLG